MIPKEGRRTEVTPTQKPANAMGLLFFSKTATAASLAGAGEVLSAGREAYSLVKTGWATGEDASTNEAIAFDA